MSLRLRQSSTASPVDDDSIKMTVPKLSPSAPTVTTAHTDDDDLSLSTVLSSDVQLATTKTASPVPKTISEVSAKMDTHDLFNLVALMPMNILTIFNMDWGLAFQGYGPETVWTGAYFNQYFTYVCGYFIVDLIYAWVEPDCVKSPKTIIKHHIFALAYLYCAIIFPKYRWFLGSCLTVEFNTWFLIARRVAYKRSDYIHHSIVKAISFMFYFTWIMIRMILYPVLFFIQISMAKDLAMETGSVMHVVFLVIPFQFVFCLFNFKWSYDLFSPIVKRLLRGGNKPKTIASGL